LVALLLGVGVIALFATACGGSDEESAEAEGPAANVAQAEQRVRESMKPTGFAAPGDPIDVSEVEGSEVWFIGATLAIPFVAEVAASFEEAAEVAGMIPSVCDGKGQVQDWNRCMNQALTSGADAIAIQAIDPRFIEQPLQRAQEMGIPVIESGVRPLEEEVPETIYGNVNPDLAAVMGRLADYAIWQSEGDVHALFVIDPTIDIWNSFLELLQAQFDRVCPRCELTVLEFDVAQLATDLPRKITTELRRDPSINWIIPPFGGAVVHAIEGMRAADALDRVRLVALDGIAANLDLIREGEVLEADIMLAIAWHGWAQIDLIARALLEEPKLNARINQRFLTEQNLAPTNDVDEILGMEPPFRDQFRRLWGVE